MKHPIQIEKHNDIYVLRDDLLEGGTKSVLMDKIVKRNPGIKEYVYASPVYGGFQIALSAYCQKHGLNATIFCAKRMKKHPNTQKCESYGAKIVEVFPGYLSVVEKRAREYCEGKPHTHKLVFGAGTSENINVLAARVEKVIQKMKSEPDEIWVAVGSGTLVQGILQGTRKAKVYGVVVGADFDHSDPRLTLLKYPKPFEYESKLEIDFPSMANYDRKAFEMCLAKRSSGTVLFWNVL
jgi:1-aminocyclopropane-1-carboxylate deaminase/D-cysteine desulfhydrase-like pyridoxal-dependent ACC family enzyme